MRIIWSKNNNKIYDSEKVHTQIQCKIWLMWYNNKTVGGLFIDSSREKVKKRAKNKLILLGWLLTHKKTETENEKLIRNIYYAEWSYTHTHTSLSILGIILIVCCIVRKLIMYTRLRQLPPQRHSGNRTKVHQALIHTLFHLWIENCGLRKLPVCA